MCFTKLKFLEAVDFNSTPIFYLVQTQQASKHLFTPLQHQKTNIQILYCHEKLKRQLRAEKSSSYTKGCPLLLAFSVGTNNSNNKNS